MKSIGEIMKEMGFNPDSPIETQKAFFKHLVQQADAKQLEKQEIKETKKPSEPEQLEFQLGDDKKVS